VVAEIVADNPKANPDRDKMTIAFLDIVNSSWTIERIADLERRLDAMDAAPIPAPAKRAKLKGGTNG